MSRSWIIFALFMVLSRLLYADDTNDFYSKSSFKELGKPVVELSGEISSPGVIDLSGIPLRRVINRECEISNGKKEFRGAYRFEGYSLFDILSNHLPQKKNAQEFKQTLDLLVAVENKAGERVIVSWGEIFYPAAENRIIIAVRASPIIPILAKQEWPLPDHPRLICGNDLFSARNLDNPSKITVFSAPISFPKKDFKELYSAQITLFMDGKKVELPAITRYEKRTCPSIFYGRGKGFQGYKNFSGYLLKAIMQEYVAASPEIMKTGCFVLFSVDGYRIALSYSELCNRNDQAEFLLIDEGKGQSGGRYSVFPAADFFSDRAIKAIHEIYFMKLTE
jgi:hypothetical protein